MPSAQNISESTSVTAHQLVIAATAQLEASAADVGLCHAAQEARWLLEHYTGIAWAALMVAPAQPLTPEQKTTLDRALVRRLAGEPLAWILGEQPFWTFSLKVAPCTLIPRADTETLVVQALSLALPTGACVLDLGTGTGAIALALKQERPTWCITGVDSVSEAVDLARDNAQRLKLVCQFLLSDWFSVLTGEIFDLICSNPPYIDVDDMNLAASVAAYEPHSALISGASGLANLILIIDQAPLHLSAGGWLLLEHGWQQGHAVRALLQRRGFQQVATAKDLGARERATFGQWL